MLATTYREQLHYYSGDYDRVIELAIDNLAASPPDADSHFQLWASPVIYDRVWIILSLAQLGRFAEVAQYEADAIRLAERTLFAFNIGLVHRAVGILRRRGELPGFVVDGTAVELQSRAPLARLQARQDVQNVLLWLDTITRLGPEASGVLNMGEAARWLATMLGVPDELVAEPSPLASLAAALNAPGIGHVGA